MKTQKELENEMIRDNYHGQPKAIIVIVAFVFAGLITGGIALFIWIFSQLFAK